MISQLTSRSGFDSRPCPLEIPGRRIKVRSLIEFYNQKALYQAIITSRPYQDRDKIPHDKVKSLVLSYTNVLFSTTPKSSLSSGVWVARAEMTHPVVLKGVVEVSSNADNKNNIPYSRSSASEELRYAKIWKSARGWKSDMSVMKAEVDEPVARRSTRRKKKEGSRGVSLKNFDSSEGTTVLPRNEIQSLTASRQNFVGSGITRSSSLEVGISVSPGDTITNRSRLTPRSSRIYIEEKVTKGHSKAMEGILVPMDPSNASKPPGTWIGAFQSVRDSFRRRPSVADLTISTKESEEAVPTYKSKPLKPILDSTSPEPLFMDYITAPDTFRVFKNQISAIQTQVNRLHMLEALASETEDKNNLPSDQEHQKSVPDADRALQEVSSSTPSQAVQDPNTISGVGEMATWSNSASRRKRPKTISKRRRSGCRPVANALRVLSPVRMCESSLEPVSPLRVIKDKAKTMTKDISEWAVTFNLPRGSSSEAQKKKALAGKETPVALVKSTFESLVSLATPPPANPPQEIRSPGLIREMAFPELSLRDGEQDTPMRMGPMLKRKVAMEHISIPKKVIYGDADWRIDRGASGGGGDSIDGATQRLQEFWWSNDTSDLYSDQRTSLVSEIREFESMALSRKNHVVPDPEAGISSRGCGGIETKQSFSKCTINPSPPAGTPPPVSQFYEKIRQYKPQSPIEGTSTITMSLDKYGKQITRGRRKRRIGS